MTEITLTDQQVAEVKGNSLNLTDHERRILLPSAIVDTLEDYHQRYLDPSPWNTTRHNTQDAAAAHFSLLRKVRPEVADSFKQHHGVPVPEASGREATVSSPLPRGFRHCRPALQPAYVAWPARCAAVGGIVGMPTSKDRDDMVYLRRLPEATGGPDLAAVFVPCEDCLSDLPPVAVVLEPSSWRRHSSMALIAASICRLLGRGVCKVAPTEVVGKHFLCAHAVLDPDRRRSPKERVRSVAFFF